MSYFNQQYALSFEAWVPTPPFISNELQLLLQFYFTTYPIELPIQNVHKFYLNVSGLKFLNLGLVFAIVAAMHLLSQPFHVQSLPMNKSENKNVKS